MKKFTQVSLVFVLALALIQTTTGGSLASVGRIGSNVTGNTSIMANMPVQGVQAATCFSGVSCIKPNVGWNS